MFQTKNQDRYYSTITGVCNTRPWHESHCFKWTIKVNYFVLEILSFTSSDGKKGSQNLCVEVKPESHIILCRGFCDILNARCLAPLRNEQRNISARPRSHEMQRVWTPTLPNKSNSVFEFVGVKKFISAHLHIVWQFACYKLSNWFHFNVLSTYWLSKIFFCFVLFLQFFRCSWAASEEKHSLACQRSVATQIPHL